MPTCAKCNQPVIARGLCHRHYKAYVMAHLLRDEETGCWIYAGETNSHGYGRLRIQQRTILVHKFLWEIENGPVPDGLELDHFICFTPACANPLHLEAVTHAENSRRHFARHKFCRNGHPRVPENLTEYRGWKVCLVCRAVSKRKRELANA